MAQTGEFDKLIQKMDQLNALLTKVKLQDKLELPRIAVVGQQSSGKSSVLTTIIGEDVLPKDNKLCTRCPIRLQLVNVKTKEEEYAFSTKDPEKKIKLTDLRQKIVEEQDEVTGHQKYQFSETPISFTIQSTQCPNLTLVDLPGWMANPIEGQSEDAPRIVQELITNYCKDDHTILMCVTQVSNDLQACMGIKLCRELDKDGDRTISILTKCDKAHEDHELKRLATILENKDDFINFKHGFRAVINRTFEEEQNDVPLSEVKKKEEEWFNSKEQLKKVRDTTCGSTIICRDLNKLLSSKIKEYLPTIKDKLTKQKTELTRDLDSLPKQMEEHQKLKYIREMVFHFEDAFIDLFEGNYKEYQGYAGYKYIEDQIGQYGTDFKNISYTLYQKELEKVPTSSWDWEQKKQEASKSVGWTQSSIVSHKLLAKFLKDELKDIEYVAIKYIETVQQLVTKAGHIATEALAKDYPKYAKCCQKVVEETIKENRKDVEQFVRHLIDVKQKSSFIADEQFQKKFDKVNIEKMNKKIQTQNDDIISQNSQRPIHAKEIDVDQAVDEVYEPINFIGKQVDLIYVIHLKNLRDTIPQIVKADLVYQTSQKVSEIIRSHDFQQDLLKKNYFNLDPKTEEERMLKEQQVATIDEALNNFVNEWGIHVDDETDET